MLKPHQVVLRIVVQAPIKACKYSMQCECKTWYVDGVLPVSSIVEVVKNSHIMVIKKQNPKLLVFQQFFSSFFSEFQQAVGFDTKSVHCGKILESEEEITKAKAAHALKMHHPCNNMHISKFNKFTSTSCCPFRDFDCGYHRVQSKEGLSAFCLHNYGILTCCKSFCFNHFSVCSLLVSIYVTLLLRRYIQISSQPRQGNDNRPRCHQSPTL